MKLKILSVGKNKEAWLEEALEEYVKRLKPFISIQFLWVKNDGQLLLSAQKESSLICLDPAGALMASEEFSQFLHHKLQEAGSHLTLVIGGPEGLPSSLKQNHPLLSLSPLTMTHQIVRLVLMEQIYRAFEIKKGSKYHK